MLNISNFKQVIALFNREVVNKAVSLFAAARNILYNYKIFNLGIDLTTNLIVNFTYNGILNKA